MKMLKITLKRSLIGKPEKHRKIVRALGLKRPNDSVIKEDVPSIKGMFQKVSHLIEVKEGSEN
ncbi:MAG: 50S ribosomal protein L30 [Nitrospirae bacterium]|nr:50S ribosomal protein L30 [Nitrospirota bacterium]